MSIVDGRRCDIGILFVLVNNDRTGKVRTLANKQTSKQTSKERNKNEVKSRLLVASENDPNLALVLDGGRVEVLMIGAYSLDWQRRPFFFVCSVAGS